MLAVTALGAPPYGGPMAGTVYDSRTGLAIGGATLIADWAPSITTSNDGRFNMPNLLPAGSVSVARAGYVTQTRQGSALTDHPDVYLEPRNATNGTGASRGIGLAGTVLQANRPV
ncbi:MAG: carboxypeptidase regulatory-like domain-containing protein, partial [Candidatus Sericytochromatia bacterium]|nr:carboxypeptidase regulatory-like domain-containing protein [Candidatus Sericytochromatia bacterium]